MIKTKLAKSRNFTNQLFCEFVAIKGQFFIIGDDGDSEVIAEGASEAVETPDRRQASSI